MTSLLALTAIAFVAIALVLLITLAIRRVVLARRGRVYAARERRVRPIAISLLEGESREPPVLSPGELRLLSFARLVLAQPAFAFLDVGVSGLDDFWVHTLYRTLSKTKTVYVSIWENETLRAYHDVELILAGHGAWAVNEARQVAAG